MLNDVEKVHLGKQISTIEVLGVEAGTIKGLQQKLANISPPDLAYLERVLYGECRKIEEINDKGIPVLRLTGEIPGAANHYYFWALYALSKMIRILNYNIRRNIEERKP